jgi:hypothetical protein
MYESYGKRVREWLRIRLWVWYRVADGGKHCLYIQHANEGYAIEANRTQDD